MGRLVGAVEAISAPLARRYEGLARGAICVREPHMGLLRTIVPTASGPASGGWLRGGVRKILPGFGLLGPRDPAAACGRPLGSSEAPKDVTPPDGREVVTAGARAWQGAGIIIGGRHRGGPHRRRVQGLHQPSGPAGGPQGEPPPDSTTGGPSTSTQASARPTGSLGTDPIAWSATPCCEAAVDGASAQVGVGSSFVPRPCRPRRPRTRTRPRLAAGAALWWSLRCC